MFSFNKTKIFNGMTDKDVNQTIEQYKKHKKPEINFNL